MTTASNPQAAIEHLLQTVTIPTLPGVVSRINALLNDPESGMPEVAEVIVQDASISAKVLRMANSAYYGLAQPVASIQQAALVLGGQVLRNIAMQASVIQKYDHLESTSDFDVKVVWKHAVSTAQTAQSLAMRVRNRSEIAPDEFYTCGLLHDMGKIVMLDSLGERYLDAVRHRRSSGRSMHELESEAFGFHHADVGATLAALWKLPRQVTAAIRFHHGPAERIDQRDGIALVVAADRIANAARSPELNDPESVLDETLRERLGISVEDVVRQVEQARSGLSSIEV